MQLHELKKTIKQAKRKRVGRGGKKGTYSGKGQKGQMSRSSSQHYPGFAGGDTPFYKRFPKQRGKFVGRLKPQVVNIETLEKFFETGATITPVALADMNLIVINKGRVAKVKILGNGEISKKLTISGCTVSASAKAKIEKAGGKIEA